MCSNIILNLAQPSDRQTATVVRLLRSDISVFLGEVNREKLCDCPNTLRASCGPGGQHLCASKTQIRQRFIAAEEFGDLNLTCLLFIERFECGKTRIHGNVDVDHV